MSLITSIGRFLAGTKTRTRHIQRPELEPLGDRVLLSGITVALKGSTLEIKGTDRADDIVVKYVGYGNIVVFSSRYEYPSTQVGPGFDARRIREINIDARGGNDVVGATLHDKKITIRGGAGNDSLQALGVWGVAGNNLIEGGRGHDYIAGSWGNDTLRGGSGNDTIVAWAGNDRVYGDEGNDTLYSCGPTTDYGEPDDRLWGGTGADFFKVWRRAERIRDFKASEGDTSDVPASAPRVETLPGTMSEIAVGANGTVWALGREEIHGGHRIYRWNASRGDWDRMPGAADKIAVDESGSAWMVNTLGDIFQWVPSRNNWNYLNTHARDIAVGGGSVFILDDQWTWGGYEIRKLNRHTGAWESMSGQGIKIAADRNGRAYHLNAHRMLYVHSNGQWTRLPGEVRSFAVSPSGEIFMTPHSNTPGDTVVHRWNGSAWVPLGFSATTITTGGGGVFYALDSGGRVRRVTL